ncbi:MAG: glycosyltransferase family 4 protein [Hyphomicrobiaceae bacterium]
MKIWQLVDARSVGGIERHVATLVKALCARRFEAQVVLWRGYTPSSFRDQLVAEGVPHRVLDGSLRSYLAALTRERPALVHTHGYKANLVGRLVARACGIPVVSTYHSGDRGTFPVSLYLAADIATSRLAPRIAVSDEIAGRLPQPVSVVRNFLMVEPTPPAASLPRRVGFIGRLSPEKGPDLFCRIAAAAPPGIEWHVWGDGPMHGELQRTFGDRIVFHGLTLDVGQALRSIGLLLMPSRAEGLPMAALEAMAAGVPVAASRVGGMPGLIAQGDNGWLFQSADVAEAVSRIAAWRDLDHEAQIALRRRCHATVLGRYSDTAVLPEMLEIYRKAGLPDGDQAPAGEGARYPVTVADRPIS